MFSGPCDVLPTVGIAYTVAFNPLVPDHLVVGNEGAATIWDWKNDKPVHITVAGEQVPFKGSLAGTDIGIPQVPPLVDVTVEAAGNATPVR